MIKGTVKFYSQAKGFGFITPEGGGADVFVPAATLLASKVSSLKAGQRVTFETQPDKKGAKAANLFVEAEQPRDEQPVEQPARAVITVYYDPALDESGDILAALKMAGEEILPVDYMTSPPSRDQLQRLSILLRDCNQSLVRRYHPLFLELRLDDRFIGDGEFWTAVIEHPQLINGPVLAIGNRARICKTEEEVRAFFEIDGNPEKRRKLISPRILAMIKGDSVGPRPEPVVEAPEEKAVIPAPAMPAPKKSAKREPAQKQQKTRTIAPKKAPKPKAAAKKAAPTKKTVRKKNK